MKIPEIGWRAWLAWALFGLTLAAGITGNLPLIGRILSVLFLAFPVVLLIRYKGRGWGKLSLLVWTGLLLIPSFYLRTVSEVKAHLAELRETDHAAYISYVKDSVPTNIFEKAIMEFDPETYKRIQAEIAAEEAAKKAAEQRRKEQARQEKAARKAAEKAAALREEQNAELARIKQEDPMSWLRKLKEMQPDRYEEVLASREAETQRLEAEVRPIPASEYEKNRELYRELLALNPGTLRYFDRYHHYNDKIEERDWREASCTTGYPEDLAGQEAKALVKQVLKSPRSAKFPSFVRGEYVGDCEFVVESYVDSQNSFGAEVRTYYTARLLRSRGGWGLIAIETD